MSKQYYIILFLSFNAFSQQKISITNEARYELNFKQYKNKKTEYIKNTFILLFNNNESCYKNMSLYVKDSLIDAKKINIENEDLATYQKYSPELPHTVYKKGNLINFANRIVDNEIRYIEIVDFQWKITKETKVVNGVKCIKATTSKWGRNWIAYYSPKHPMPFGPYKFYGLPGLIFEVADDKKDYTFILYRFKNRNQKNVALHNYPKAKTVSKKQYEKIRHNIAITPSNIVVKGHPDINKKINLQRQEEEKNYNPIELTE